MNVENGKIADPLIAPSGKIYSLAGLKNLLQAVFEQNPVDNPMQCCKRNQCRGESDGEAGRNLSQKG